MAKRVFLMIADIGGYTRFMTVHRINLSHAQYVVAQLLEAVIDAAGKGLRLSKLEGDAAFFYSEIESDAEVAKLVGRIGGIRAAFLKRREQLASERTCTCDGCVQSAKLRLKFVAHAGEAAFQKVKRHNELAGVDVIVVHRLLKNTVPIDEYALVSDAVHERLDEGVRQGAVATDEELEGIGPMRAYYIDLAGPKSSLPPPPPPPAPLWRRALAWLKMTLLSLPYFIGVRSPCAGYRNMGEVCELPPPPEPFAPKRLGM